ncbi:rootletin [Phymastichus coffea]|uniref:rootletin n=1 Tax=Phymastichus coffea TaxID=108790 RepID=UPI00273C757A|nr:rootletin [Phymastichus coffea]
MRSVSALAAAAAVLPPPPLQRTCTATLSPTMIPKQPRIASIALREQMNRRRQASTKPAAAVSKAKEFSGASRVGQRSLSEIRASARGASESDENGEDAGALAEEAFNADELVRKNYELRHRLEEEAASYKRRLDTYRQAQQHQAALVSRLQAKVLQYKQRCSELESQMAEASLPCGEERASSAPGQLILQAAQQTMREMREEHINDLETALKRLHEERNRSDKLLQLNVSLKDQLEESHSTNEALTSDLQKLSSEWDALREELSLKEAEWKEEELAFNEYFNSEYNKLHCLWNDAVSLKRLYSDMKFATERDLSKLRGHLNSAVSDTVAACSSTSFLMKLQAQAASSFHLPATKSPKHEVELQAAVKKLDAAHTEIRAKDERIQQLLREVQSLEEKCAESEASLSQRLREQEDASALQSALRDIASVVIQDAEMRELELVSHLHLSPGATLPAASGGCLKRSARPASTIPAFAESTISAVQAALHKYQLTIHELTVKLQTSQEQLSLSRKQAEGLDERLIVLEEKNAELISQVDSLRSQSAQLSQEREILQKALDSARSDNAHLDKSRLESASKYNGLSADYENVAKINMKLDKLCRSLEDEKTYLQCELDRVNKDCESREASLRAEEERSSKLREEILSVAEELNKAQLAKEVLEQNKIESECYLAQVEKSKAELELDLERLILVKSELEEMVTKLQSICLSHEQESARLQDELRRANEEKTQLSSQCADQQSDMTSLRKELLAGEQARMSLENDKVTLHEKAKFLEIEKERLEVECAQISRERADLSNQLAAMARSKEALNEEYVRLSQKHEHTKDMINRINRDVAELVKSGEEKQIILESNDKEIQGLIELLSSLRSEKEALETALFDTTSNLEDTHAKRQQLEKENQELLIKQESLKNQVHQLKKEVDHSEKHARDVKMSLTQLSEKQELEFQAVLADLKKQSEEALRRLNEEKDQTRISLEQKLQQIKSKLEQEKNNEISQLSQRLDELLHEKENLCQQHEEILLRAENDKQQSLLLAHQDQQVLQEKVDSLQRELEGEKGASERLRRESASREEKDRGELNKLRDELTRIKNRLEELKARSDEEKLKLEIKLEEIKNEREAAMKEVEELQVQLHVSEDKVDDIQNQLLETSRKLKEAEVTIENARKELVDVRRQLNESNFEKDKYSSTNKELRERIKHVEGEKREQARLLEESYQKLAGLEEAKATLESDRNRIQSNVRDTEREILQLQQQLRLAQEELDKAHNANCQAQNNEKELQARLSNETEERERLQLQLHQLRKQSADLENNLELTRQELSKLRSRMDEEDERSRGREQELVLRLEESRCRERKLEDQKHNLEVCLTDATQQLQELKARLGGSEGRVRALDEQLTHMEARKKDLEHKLSSLVLMLKRIAGVQPDGSLTTPFKLSSPTRRYSPVRTQEHSDSRELILDVDVEAVRRGINSLMKHFMKIERERNDYDTELKSIRKQLAEGYESQNKLEIKMNALVTNIRNLQDEKYAVEAKLTQKHCVLQQINEKLKEKSDECDRLREKIVALELSVNSGTEEKLQNDEKIERLKQAIGKMENDKRIMKEDINKFESRVTQMEVNRMSLEGDIQRLQMIVQDKESTIQKLQERNESQARTMSNLEERCASLKSTIEQLNHALEKSVANESELKTEINHMHRNLVEVNAHSQSDTEKLKQLQKQLSVVESDRRVQAERLENVQSSLNELRHANQLLSDQNARLQSDLANAEVVRSGLEAQLRFAQMPGNGSSSSSSNNKDEELYRQLQLAHRERSELKGKVDALNDKVKNLENEKRQLERQVSCARASCVRSKSYERHEHSKMHSDLSHEHLERDNCELRLKVSRLECALADRETEIAKLRAELTHSHSHSDFARSSELEKFRAAQLQAQKLLEAREQSHRHQVIRLEAQIRSLRDQLNQEIKLRQIYVHKSSRTGREMQQIRHALGESLRTVSQEPRLDADLLEHETRKLEINTNVPPSLALPAPLSYERRSPSSLL